MKAAQRLAAPESAPPVAAFCPRTVVIRIDDHPEQLALLVGQPAQGFWHVRIWRPWQRVYSPKVRRILAAELVRDASGEEIQRGRLLVSR